MPFQVFVLKVFFVDPFHVLSELLPVLNVFLVLYPFALFLQLLNSLALLGAKLVIVGPLLHDLFLGPLLLNSDHDFRFSS